MTKEEFINFAQKSEVFKSMDPKLQENILNASENLIPRYFKVLQNGETALNESKKQFQIKQEKIVKTYSEEIKKIKSIKLKKDEIKAVEEDGNASEKLLQDLNKI